MRTKIRQTPSQNLPRLTSAFTPSDTPGVPPGPFPTSAPYINHPPTEAPDYSGVQFSSTCADQVAHPLTCKAPRHDGGVGDSAAVRYTEAPGEMGARGGSHIGEGMMDQHGTKPGEGSLGERNPPPDVKGVAENNSAMGLREAWKTRK
ncbi:hypothetical protein MPER_08659 [Moniliophthora perniciosa FA553]|nr:hypothetical protein MPER_08659 [Moniliophthora perniciosa FA553]